MFRSGLAGAGLVLVLGVRQQQHLPGPAKFLHETFLPPVVDSPVVLPSHGGATDEAVHDGLALSLSPLKYVRNYNHLRFHPVCHSIYQTNIL